MHIGRLALGAVLTIAAAAVAVSSCGSSSSTTKTSATVAWADGLCSAVTTFKASLKTTGTTVQKGALSKSALNDAIASVKNATQTFVTTVKGLGAPGTSSGQTVKQTLDGLASSLQADARTIEGATSGSALSAVSVVSTTLVTAKDHIATALGELKKVDAKGELHNAFSQASSCSAFGV
jgi:hypothetical protein